MIYDAIIIGGGPGGITAGIYLVRSGKTALIIERGAIGGKVFQSHKIENYPGFESVSGQQLSKNMEEQARKLGVEFITDEVSSIKVTPEQIKQVTTRRQEYTASNVIIATGTEKRLLKVEGEAKYSGRGVSYCAVCDGAFFKNKPVVVVGGGSSAFQEAMYLANICEKVTIIHRSSHFRAEKIWVDKAKSKSNVEIITDATLEEIQGETVVTSVKIKHLDATKEIPTDGVFIYIGFDSQATIFNNLPIFDQDQNLIINEHFETPVPGVYAIGDVLNKELKQIVGATNDGSVAAAHINNKH